MKPPPNQDHLLHLPTVFIVGWYTVGKGGRGQDTYGLGNQLRGKEIDAMRDFTGLICWSRSKFYCTDLSIIINYLRIKLFYFLSTCYLSHRCSFGSFSLKYCYCNAAVTEDNNKPSVLLHCDQTIISCLFFCQSNVTQHSKVERVGDNIF